MINTEGLEREKVGWFPSDGTKKEQKAWYKNYHKECYQTIHGRAKSLFYSARKRKMRKGAESDFSITVKWIMEKLERGICEVTGLPFDWTPSKTSKMPTPFAPSLDRADSFKGYTMDNVQVVCRVYNQAKNSWTHADVMKMVNALKDKDSEHDH